jgi:hypothetical protein
MKNISKLLQKSNLTPRERIMAVIKNDIQKEKTGASVLSEADVHALSEGWSPRDNHEVQEYNKYWNTWDTFVKLGMDMQTLYYTALLDLAEIEKTFILYYFNDDKSKMRMAFDKQSSDEQATKMQSYILDNTGIEYKNLIHRHAFHSLPKSLQEDMLSLHPEVEYDSSYFDEEEQLATILKGKKDVTEKEADALTAIIMNGILWDRKEFMESKGLNFSDTLFHAYFAGYPLMRFAEKLAEVHEIDYDDEDDLKQKISKIKNLKDELMYVIHDAIVEGLFFDEYVPLCNSETYTTHSGKTKLKHKIIMSRWLKAKQKAIDEIQGYIDSNHLVLEDRDEYIFTVPITKTIVTGKSLYYADDSLLFIEEYKKQFDILMDYSFLFEVIEKRDISQQYGQLLRYKEITDQMSSIVGEEATDFAQFYVTQIQEKIEQLNLYSYGIQDQMSEAIFMKNSFTFSIEMFFDDLKLDLSNIQSQSHKSLDIFEERANKYLGNEWKHNTV